MTPCATRRRGSANKRDGAPQSGGRAVRAQHLPGAAAGCRDREGSTIARSSGITTVGLDLSKNVFQVHQADGTGRSKVRRIRSSGKAWGCSL